LVLQSGHCEPGRFAATMASPASAVRQAANAYFYVGVWMSVSIGVILFNKWLLAFAGFPFPITLTLWHMCFCSVAGFICVRFLKVSKQLNMSVEEYMTRVMPIGVDLLLAHWNELCCLLTKNATIKVCRSTVCCQPLA